MKKWIVLYHHKHGTNVYLVEHPEEPSLDDLLKGIPEFDRDYEGDRGDDETDFNENEWVEVLSTNGFEPLRLKGSK